MRHRHRIALLSCLLCCLAWGIAGTARAAGEEAAVRALIARNIEGWSSYDAAKVAGCYSEDATWQNPFGVRLHGPKEIETFLVKLFARPGYRAAKDTMPATIQQVRLLGPDAAVVWSEEASTGQTENGQPLGDRHSHYLQVLHRSPAGWRITDELIMDER